MSSTRRVTVTLPNEIIRQLDFASEKMQLSRSAFLSALLVNSLPGVCSVLSHLPDDPDDASDVHARRFRGAAVDSLSAQLASLLSDDGVGNE